MSYQIDETHDPDLKSWVESANDPETDFPIQNLPLGLFMRSDPEESNSIGVAIGDQVLDLSMLAEILWESDYSDFIADACMQETLEYVLFLDQDERLDLRYRLSELLRADNDSEEREIAAGLLTPVSEVQMLVPFVIGDYTDFYASIHHATNIGKMFRPDSPLMPNYKWVPIGYHGRASSVVSTGTDIPRPTGQTMDDQADAPNFGPSKMLDYEMELGFFIGDGNDRGEPVPIAEAEKHIFGFCLVNDWSARDIQRWEYQPLGPFLSKSFATTISPWIVTAEALAPFRAPAFERPSGDPKPLPYLDSTENRERGGYDINLEVYLSTREMRAKGMPSKKLSRSNTRDLYWTPAQMIAHHTSNGCNLQPCDLIASGTVSGPTDDSLGCLIELTQRGTKPIELPTGETRRFLEDGDQVVMRGFCERKGFRRIGFGECSGVILGRRK